MPFLAIVPQALIVGAVTSSDALTGVIVAGIFSLLQIMLTHWLNNRDRARDQRARTRPTLGRPRRRPPGEDRSRRK